MPPEGDPSRTKSEESERTLVWRVLRGGDFLASLDWFPGIGVGVVEHFEGVNPDLVARDGEGKPYTVRYEAVNAMLLNEFLKLVSRRPSGDPRVERSLKLNCRGSRSQIQVGQLRC